MTADHRAPEPRVTVTKLHGLGNDFLVLLDARGGFSSGPAEADEAHGAADAVGGAADGAADEAHGAADAVDGAARAVRLCQRHTGIGADGLVVGWRIGGGGGGGPRLRFRLWNADGSEAEMSGNGMRCLAHAALDAGWIRDGETVTVTTPAGRRSVTIGRDPHDPASAWGTVDMGPVKVRGEEHRCNVGHGQLLVDVGNPHLVVVGPDPSTVDVARLGPTLEATDAAGLNVEFVALGPGRDTLTMRVWERGVGETEACGTGSVAAAAALHHWGRVGRSVTVRQPGGDASVALTPGGSAMLSGPSRHIAVCTVPA
jgi:diaminopimelate epimerase